MAGINWKFWEKKAIPEIPKKEASFGIYNNIFTVSFDGEKTLGEMGPVKDYRPDYNALRFRSSQCYLESEIAQFVLKKFALWVVGSGLKLTAEPAKNVLKSEKIDLDSETFNDLVEARFAVFAKSAGADYSNMRNLQKVAKRAFLNAIIGGDVLVVLRYIKDQVKVQLIDGAHVQSPFVSDALIQEAIKKGNTIRHGVELSPTGEHIAYYVKKKGTLWGVERIEAVGKSSGLKMAFMVYGLEYRLDDVRGMPIISAVMETMKKLERYKEATVGSAEERQKITLFAEHTLGSTGEAPWAESIAKAINPAGDQTPKDDQGKDLQNNVVATTNKQFINLPINTTLKSLDSKNELYFKDFYTVNIDLVCAAIGIPPEVAQSKYNSNFSASRAALKDWEHTIFVNRAEFADSFFQPVYNLWLETEILKNKIQAPGYLSAKASGNYTVVESYRQARFLGPTVPHIDPVKEVEAERRKLGAEGASLPLTTVEKATEVLNSGDSDSNMEQFSKELEYAKELKIQQTIQNTQQGD